MSKHTYQLYWPAWIRLRENGLSYRAIAAHPEAGPAGYPPTHSSVHSFLRARDARLAETWLDFPGEEWRPIRDREGSLLTTQYEVSQLGRVRSWHHVPGWRREAPQLISGRPRTENHLQLRLYLEDGTVAETYLHQAIAWSWIGREPKRHDGKRTVVRHVRNPDPRANEWSNLAFGIDADNRADSQWHETGTLDAVRVYLMREYALLGITNSESHTADFWGTSVDAVRRILEGTSHPTPHPSEAWDDIITGLRSHDHADQRLVAHLERRGPLVA